MSEQMPIRRRHCRFAIAGVSTALATTAFSAAYAQTERAPVPAAPAPAAPVPAAPENSAATTLAPVVVTETALKIAIPLSETPRSVSVVDQQELIDRNVQSLDDALRYRAGILTGQFGDDNNTDWFKVRGFDAITYQDGLRIYQEGFYQWMVPPYGIERVEVFKGPSSILYGQAPPGGLINTISKRPTDETRGRVDAGFGNRNYRRLGFDVSGPVTDHDNVQYRLVGQYKAREGQVDYSENTRYYIAPSLNIDFTDDTQLTILTSFQRDNGRPTNPFKLAYGTRNDTPFGKVKRGTSYSEPDYDRNQAEQNQVGYQFRHVFDDTWTFKQNARYSHRELELRSSYVLARVGERQGSRGLVYRDGALDAWTIDNQLVGEWQWDKVENTLLLGLDYQHIDQDGQEGNLSSFGQPIDLFDPQYGNFQPIGDNQLVDRQIKGKQTGLYVQNQVKLYDRLVLLGGVRYDMADQTNTNRTAGTSQGYDVDNYSYTGGILFEAGYGLSPYFSYTESFDPLGRTTEAAEQYEPRQGRQYETGIKFAPNGWDGYATLAAFDLTETNTLITSPAGFQVQSGERQSQGIEFETVGYVTRDLQLIGSYSYTDAEVDQSEAVRGARAALIPRHQASLRAEYQFAPNTVLSKLKVGLGARYVGESVDGDLTVPDYTVFDALAIYDVDEHWQVQVNGTNIFDKDYVASCDYWCYYGAPASVIGNISYRW